MTTTLERPPTTPPPARTPAARALTWTGAIIGAVLLLSAGYSAVNLLVLGSDDATTVSHTASYAATPVVELIADGHVSVTTGGDRVEVERTARTALRHGALLGLDGRRPPAGAATAATWWRPGFCSASLDVTVPDGTVRDRARQRRLRHRDGAARPARRARQRRRPRRCRTSTAT